MQEVVLIDGEWKAGDAIDASQRLMSDPSLPSSVEFAYRKRVPRLPYLQQELELTK